MKQAATMAVAHCVKSHTSNPHIRMLQKSESLPPMWHRVPVPVRKRILLIDSVLGSGGDCVSKENIESQGQFSDGARLT